MLNVTLYTRKDCKLCDEVKADLNQLQSQYPHRLVEVDIDTDAILTENFGQIIPVVEVGLFLLRVDGRVFLRRLVSMCGTCAWRDPHTGDQWRLGLTWRSTSYILFSGTCNSVSDRRAWYWLGIHHFEKIQQDHALCRDHNGCDPGHYWRDALHRCF